MSAAARSGPRRPRSEQQRAAWVLPALLASLLAGCGESPGPQPGTPARMVFAAPIGAQSHLPANGTLQAFASIDGGPRIALNVDAASDTLSGTIENVALGEHTLTIIVEFVHDIFGTVELARATRTLTVSAGSNNVALAAEDYVFANADADAYTNFEEVLAGSDPQDAVSLPPAGTVVASGRWKTMRWNRSNWK